MRGLWLLSVVYATLVTALPAPPTDGLEFHTVEARQKNLPMVELPYGSYQASEYVAKGDMYVFRNIRFAAPPIGKLRFAKPAPPESMTGVQIKSKGGTCPQFLPTKILIQATNSIGGTLLSGLVKAFDLGKWNGGGPTSEDCLFLDVYVPGDALRKREVYPVVNWIWGGAFVVGNKEKHYNGTAILEASDNKVVYVSGNYRLGAFGWLSGTTVEEDSTATPNAGLHDQRAVLEWIQKYISKFGGNPNDVTAMGESAGASSIMHHLTAYGGKQDPLFKKAIIQSPAFYPAVWDRKGVDEQNFQVFAKAAGCPTGSIECLRSKSLSVISSAQQNVVNIVPEGSFGYGPAPDGAFVRQLPQLELLTGNYYKNIDSLIVSHMTKEADNFVSRDPSHTNDAAFFGMIDAHFNNNSEVAAALQRKLPLGDFKAPADRMVQYAQAAVFVCNTRYITQAYANKTYNFVMDGIHGRDVFADFYSRGGAADKYLADTIGPTVAEKYQRYITSMIRTGDPNVFKAGGAPEWPKAEMGPEIGNTLRVNKELTFFKNPANSATQCDIWPDLFAEVTNNGGYAPSGGEYKSRLGEMTSNAPSLSADASPTLPF